MFKVLRPLACLLLFFAPTTQALVFTAQPQENIEVGEQIFAPVARLLTARTGQPWTYQHPDNQLNYVDLIVEDRAELYLGDPHFVGYQITANQQRVLAQMPEQEWVLVAPQSSTGKLLGAGATAAFSCTEAATCALPPPNLGMLLFADLQVFADSPLRHPMLVSVDDARDVVDGVLNERCYCGVTRRALLGNLAQADRQQLAVRPLENTLGAAFTVSNRVSPALAEQIQQALLSAAGREATRAMRERLYDGAELVRPHDQDAYRDAATLLVDEYLAPMNRLPVPGEKKTTSVDVADSATRPANAGEGGGDGTLTIVSWGGAYSASQWNAYHKPYLAQHPEMEINEVIKESSTGGLQKLRQQVKSGNVTWDLVDMLAARAITACEEGLAMEIPHDEWLAPAPDGTPASADFGDLIVSPCLVPEIVYSTTFGYRHDLLSGRVDSIDDVFDLNRFPGKRALEKKPINNLEWALIADGVPPGQVYDLLDTPQGVARAFAKLDTIKDQVIWWEKGETPVQLLEEGKVVIASAYNGRLFASITERRQPISMMWDWQVFDLDGWIVPKGAPNLEAVKDYLRFATDTQRLADQAKYISYGPARASSAPLVGQHAELGIDMAPHMPTDPRNAQNVLLFNYDWWAGQQDDLSARFEAWLKE